ncbi:MAG: hypothetical protein HZA60_03085 [Deltaproteobacteria bacterium]|nr:hypothetical protein [Deltaproteobacteria bacterium]
MARYLIESPHTKEECLQALDEILARGPGELAKYDFGCMSGDHTGYVIVEVGSESEARGLVPSFLRGKARIVKLDKFTPEQIKSFHEMKKTA